jgi:TPR repeat protein/serine/threonine protein kinase
MNEPNGEESLFFGALRLPPPQRAAFLDQGTNGNAELRQRVEALLKAYDAGDFLEQAAADVPKTILGSVALTEKAGDRIGRYKLLQQIGEGGCGVVYMAEQLEPVRRHVALKVIKLGMDTKQVIARFEAERQALALMDHPNIARVLDAGATESGRPYFVMELVRGMRITDYCDERKLATEQRLELFTQVCQAVQHAHQKGIIHRDLKPSNILVTINDGAPVPKVIDFGIAKATNGQRLTAKTLFTAFEQFIGTPAYMSPEQAVLTSQDIDTRSDIYALGVLLYELLTGKTPFDTKELLAAGFDEMRRTICQTEPPKPSARLSTLPDQERSTTAQRRGLDAPKLISQLRGDLDWIVMKCLEKDRARRYETANGLAMDVQRHLKSEPVVACPPSAGYRIKKLIRRNRMLFSAGAAISLALISGMSFSLWMFLQERQARQEVDQARQQAVAARGNEEKLRVVAQANEKKAQTEALKSQQVAQSFKDMLSGIRPSVALGQDTTLFRVLLDKEVQRITKELTNQPGVQAELLNTIGEAYYAIGQNDQAASIQRKAVQALRRERGDNDPEVARAYTDLALVLWNEGDWSGAQRLAEDRRSVGLPAQPDYSPEVTNSSTNAARGAKDESGRLVEVEDLHRRALIIRRKAFGEDSLPVAESLNNLALVLRRERHLIPAEEYHRRALAIRRKLLVAPHPTIAASLNNLGLVLADEEKSDKAEACLREALAMRRKLFGTAHVDVANTVHNLADLLHDQGSNGALEMLFREELTNAIQRSPNKVKPEEDPVAHILSALMSRKDLPAVDTLISQLLTPTIQSAPHNLGLLACRAGILARRGRFQEAAADFTRAVELDPDEYLNWHSLAPLLLQTGQLDAYREHCATSLTHFGSSTDPYVAERIAKDCLLIPSAGVNLELIDKMVDVSLRAGTSHPAIPWCQLVRGLADYRQERFNSAVEWIVKALDRPTDDYPTRRCQAMMVLAMAHFQLRHTNEAKVALSLGIARAQDQLPTLESGDLQQSTDWLIANVLMKEAISLIEAEPDSMGITLSQEARAGDPLKATAHALSRLRAEQLLLRSDLVEAETAFRELVAANKCLFGTNHLQVADPLASLAGTLSAEHKFVEAEGVMNELLVLLEKLGSHRWASEALSRLSYVLSRCDRLADAEAAERKAVALESEFGEQWILALKLKWLAHLLQDQNKKEESKAVYHEAFLLYQEMTSLGNSKAQNDLGIMYQNGQGMDKDPKQAVAWYRLSAEQGEWVAQLNLAGMYWQGEGVKKDRAQALLWTRKSAEQGYAQAQRELGLRYYRGEVVAKDVTEAIRWWRKAAEQGDATAQNSLGALYGNGDEVAKDPAESLKWLRKAAEQNDKMAQCGIGLRYVNGDGAPKDIPEALKWLRKSAEQGYAQAQRTLAFLLFKGDGVAKDPVEAVQWWRKAAVQGDEVAQSNLGLSYEHGEGVAQDFAKAFKWIQKSADQHYATAQCHLGYMYECGIGVQKDAAAAVQWYRKAASKTNAVAQCSLGNCYDQGIGVEKDPVEAVKWYRLSAEQGYARAENNLGMMLLQGKGITKDPVEALKWVRKGAEQGDATSQMNLGDMYCRGEGVSRDPAEGLKWLRKAVKSGEPDGGNALAWHLATYPDPKFRDGTEAVHLAEQAVEKTQRQDANVLDTLAAAYAEVGEFEKAVAEEQEALRLCKADSARKQLAAHLKLFESHTPCHEP